MFRFLHPFSTRVIDAQTQVEVTDTRRQRALEHHISTG